MSQTDNHNATAMDQSQPKTGQWSASLNDEDGFGQTHDTKEQAVDSLIFDYDVEAGRTIYVGPVRTPRIVLRCHEVDDMLERARENSGDDWCDVVHERVSGRIKPDLLKELMAEVQAVLDNWADRHGIYADVFTVDADAHVVTEAEVAASKSEGQASR